MCRFGPWAQVRQQIESRLGNKPDCPFPEYTDDPVAFSREVLGWEPWEKQAAIGKALVEEQRVTAVSCNGAGKILVDPLHTSGVLIAGCINFSTSLSALYKPMTMIR